MSPSPRIRRAHTQSLDGRRHDDLVESRRAGDEAIKKSLEAATDIPKERLARYYLSLDDKTKAEEDVKALFEQIRALGYTGSYPRVVVWVRRWRERQASEPRRAAFVPMSFELGDAFQFDWSCEYVFVAGLRRRLEVAC